MNTLKQVQDIWQDNENVHRSINETFTDRVNENIHLKEYRDWIEQKIFGFGERSFIWMWKLIVDEYPDPNFLEVGVFRGQIVGLIRLLAPKAEITGITPLDNTGGHWESDYPADIKLLHDTFNLEQPKIIKGLSTDSEVMKQVADNRYDVVYIDGGHSYEVAKHDVLFYSKLVRPGGLLVVDDCANKYQLPIGYFKGITEVSQAVDEQLPNDEFKELFNVMHNRVFIKKL